MRARIVGVAIAAVILAVVDAPSAPAAPPAFDAGSGLPTVGNFSPVTLNGSDRLTSAGIAPFALTDDSGALAGWHVTLLVPNFQNGTGPDCALGATGSIPGADLAMSAPVVSAAHAQTSMNGVTAAAFCDFTTARTIVAAAVGDGAGTYDIAPAMLQLIVPADASSGAYCSQATIAITSGP